jgi:TetR/AcrR family transcriptional regulator, transcriptional repressor for nem operon
VKQRKKQPAQTREAILDAADSEFASLGYAGASLASVVASAGLTKGALFHHFPDKQSLAAAWIAERLGAGILQLWCDPLNTIDSLDRLIQLSRVRSRDLNPGDVTSALVTVAAELANRDDLLGAALESVFHEWRAAFAGALERGRLRGWIHPSIKPETEAALFVSAFAGFTVTLKTSRTQDTRTAFAAALEAYLETLRVQGG